MIIFKLLAVAIVSYLASSLIHELGHIVCGLLHKWKMYMLVVGPIKLYREDIHSNLKIGFEKNILMWGGVGGTLPTVESDINIKVWAKILLAGPLTSVVFGILMGVVMVFTKNIYLVFLCLTPLAMGLMCLIPSKMKTGLLYTDGTRYKRLKSKGQEHDEEASLFKLIEITLFAEEKSIFPPGLIAPLLKSKDFELNYYGYYYQYCNAKNIGDKSKMQMEISNMESIKHKVPKIIVDDCKLS